MATNTGWNKMPREILLIITDLLDDSSVVNLFQTCKGLNQALQSERDKRARQGFLPPADRYMYAEFSEGATPGIDLPLCELPIPERRPYRQLSTNKNMGYIIRAIVRHQYDAVKSLLDLGASPDWYSPDNEYILSYAVKTDDISILNLLLQRATVHKLTRALAPFRGRLPLHCALAMNSMRLAHALITAGADLTCSFVVRDIIAFANIEIIRLALHNGMVPTVGGGFLHRVLSRGNREIFDVLFPVVISSGVLNETDHHGCSALHVALSRPRHLSKYTSATLLSAGIDLNIVNDEGQTALHIALKNHQFGLAHDMINAGCQLNVVDRYTSNELHHAVQAHLQPSKSPTWNQTEAASLVSLLLEKGVQVNLHGDFDGTDGIGRPHIDANGYFITIFYTETPLWFAIRHGNKDMVQSILTLGPHQPDLTIRDQAGQTPLEFARKIGQLEIARMLE
ncbi:uncharacterized protein N7483_003929 [Penicillium malachiteum]|uniref:uncharacterized protein n=1 Tax=Penicillium malachiteum TaxID=1324776 RepID=UPI002548B1E9|nr:uncharacterized protein N7483_003929 [Penicillium malachiteum]KAJ5729421.1 hypothetical protein N7483_003929 [Penicillium malachiteum]